MDNQTSGHHNNAASAFAVSHTSDRYGHSEPAQTIMKTYRGLKSASTIRRQDGDLLALQTFLVEHGNAVNDLQLATDLQSWCGITVEMVEAFLQSLFQQGYALSSINLRLSTIKTYAKLALQAGVLDRATVALIRSIDGHRPRDYDGINETRMKTRRGAKKGCPLVLSHQQIIRLKEQPNTPIGRRDALLLSLLLDHGLRCSEATQLCIECFDPVSKTFTLYRSHSHREQTLTMTTDTATAFHHYRTHIDLRHGLLFQKLRKGNIVTGQGMSPRALTGRVAYLGQRIGIQGLSAQDLRHTWALSLARSGIPLEHLMELGGWSSSLIPADYLAAAKQAAVYGESR